MNKNINIRNRRGSLTIEAALTIPLLVAFLLAAVDVFRVGYAWVTLMSTVEQTAGWASGLNAAGDRHQQGEIQAKAESLAQRLGLESTDITVESYQYDNTPRYRPALSTADEATLHAGTLGKAGDHVLITGRVSVGLLIGGLFSPGGEVTVKAQATASVS